MKELYRKYVNWIVIILFILLCGKSCQGCNSNRRLEWNEIQYHKQIELYESHIDSLNLLVKDQCDSITTLHNKLIEVKSNLIEVNELNHYMRNINNKLIETTKNLSNKKEE